ncbi:MAG: hypothetical protein J1E31_08220, partial [Helicobacter sp.]|nr:hypothetical protein [Helicobacter sp.]
MQISNSSYSSFYSNYAKATNQDSKLTQDFRLTNLTKTESEKIAESKEIQQTESLQTAMLSDEEILSKVRENVDLCIKYAQEYAQRPSRYDSILDDIARSLELKLGGVGGITLDMQDPYFNERIDNKINDNWGQKITQEEMQEAQKFLNEQMDNLMLKLYKANPEMAEDTMKGDFIFYSEGGLERTANVDDICIPRDYPELKYDGKLSDILLTYGSCRIEADGINDGDYEKFLYKAKEYLSDTEKLKEIDKDTLKYTLFVIKIDGLAGYIRDKTYATGHQFFSALSDMLSPMEQEQIIEAIAKVMGFYSQPNSIEINGIKISWDTQSMGANYTPRNDGKLDMWSIRNNIGLMDFEISYPQSNLFTNVSDNLLVSLTSNFNPTQSVLEILEQKDKQEQANQS